MSEKISSETKNPKQTNQGFYSSEAGVVYITRCLIVETMLMTLHWSGLIDWDQSHCHRSVAFICLLVHTGFFTSYIIENISVIYGDVRQHYRFLTYARHSLPLSSKDSLPQLLWHRASVYNSQLRGPNTLTPVAERLAVELSLRQGSFLSSCKADHKP